MSDANSTIVVYGANGFIGRNLCLHLSSLEHKTIAVSRTFDPGFSSQLSDSVTLKAVDFSDLNALWEEVVPATGAIHILLVSNSVPSTFAASPSLEVSGNLLSHVRFLERLSPADRVVFLSSGGTIYGIPSEHRPLKENDAVSVPISAYGVTKFAIEKYLAYVSDLKGFDYVILRPSNPVGPWCRTDSGQGVVGVFLQRYLAGEPITLWGDGSVTRDYIDVRDLARAIEAVAMNRALTGQTYNVGSGIPRTLCEVVSAIESTLDIDLAVQTSEGRAVDVPYNVLDSRRITEATGWRPEFTFEDTIRDTYHYLSSLRD